MKFLDNLSKQLSSGVERAKFETDKFQRTSKINSDIGNVKAQIDTNMRQLGERALELYQQGILQAPEIASLAQIISQLREQQQSKERDLELANAETFEQYQASQPQTPAPSADQNIPISREPSSGGFPTPGGSGTSAPYSTDVSGTGLPNSSSVSGVDTTGTSPHACASCGFALPAGAVFCPNCGARSAA